MSSLKRLIVEVHRRSLWQVLLIYGGGSWVVFEVVQTLTEGLGLPGWFPALALVLLIVLLPLVLATAFVREGEPAAAVSDPTLIPVDEARTEAARRRFLTWRNAAASFVVALAVWGIIATGWLMFGGPRSERVEATSERPGVAALPFANLSGREEDAYFTDGIHGEVLTQLQKIGGLRVVSRTSVVEYRNSPKNAREIGVELNAQYLLEGEILRAAEDVRVNVQLIDSRTDEHVWAEIYDRELSVENLLDVQSEIARQIALALKTELTPEERRTIESRPTENLDAYQAYLRGLYFMHLPHFTVENRNKALHEFERAVELDSTFALAHAQLALAHAQKVFFQIDASQHQRDLATAAAERAVRLSPESPDVRLALGLYHLWLHRDPLRALEEIDWAEEGLPSSQAVLEARAAVYDLQGRFEEAVDVYSRALELSPRDVSVLTYLAQDNWLLRRYDRAEAYADRAMTLRPDQFWPKFYKALIIWSDRSANEESEAVLEALPHGLMWVRWARYRQRMYQGRYSEAVNVLSETDSEWIRVKMWARPHSLLAALAHEAMGQRGAAKSLFEEARLALEHEVETQPEDPRYHSSLGLAYAGLGMKEQAVLEAERAVELLPLSVDAMYGLPYLVDRAAVYTMIGDEAAAVNELEGLLSVPSWISPVLLERDPRFSSLSLNPRFQALLAR